jgi:hypothetical protein
MLRTVLAKMLFCDETNLHYVLLHIPVGIVNALIPIVLYFIFGTPGAWFGGWLAVVFGVGFIAYEVTEWEVIKDVLYPDLQGWLWGMGLCVGVTLVVWLL